MVTAAVDASGKIIDISTDAAARADGARPTFLRVDDGPASYLYPSDAVGTR